MEIKKGQIYRHFKGDIMEIIGIAKHSEDLSELVLYIHKKEENPTIWARPIEMWHEKVDKEKYPDVTQEYRFELVNEKTL